MKSPEALAVTVQPGTVVTALLYPAASDGADAVLILGHGAGAGQRSPWMVERALDLSARGLDIATFNFPYTEQGRSMPDRAPLLEACYRAVIDAVANRGARRRQSVFIGGKSMGGRIATHVAAADPALPVNGLVLLGYPLHPPGQPAKRRDAHLPSIVRPMLFVQGSRDTFGTPAELQPVLEKIPAPTLLHVIDGGDHSFKLGKKDPARQAAVFDDVHRTIVDWVSGITHG